MGCTTITFCSFLFSILIISSAVDTLRENQTISDGETIVSAGGEFEMGFFSPKGSPQNRYFGIWYKKISLGTVIWVANREAPITNTSGIIKVSIKGIIVSTNVSTDNTIWSSNYSKSVNNPVAQLLDNGNLVFRDENDENNFVWQSFDYIGDNFLPGMKLGVNLISGINRYYLAWKSENDPSPGNYIHRLDPEGYPQMLSWKDSIVSYRAGPWVGSTFSGLPNLASNGIYTPKFVITDKEIYYAFDLVNKSESPITRNTLTPAGEVKRLIWNKQEEVWKTYLTLQVNDCDSYGLCGAYGVCNQDRTPRCQCMEGFDPKKKEDWEAADGSSGCSRKVQLDCGNGDGFSTYSGVKLPDTRWSTYNLSMRHTECESKCLKDCNCTAYSSTDTRNGGSGCLLWFGDLKDIRGYSNDGQDLYVRMAASELKANKISRQKKRLRIILIPLCIVLTAVLGLLLWKSYKKRNIHRAGVLQLNSVNDTKKLHLPIFNFIQIANATNNFSSNNKLGEGGFGTVYKGMLEEGHEIAVKRLSKDSRQGVDEFMNEVTVIANLQHRNLVRLLGCCIDEGERMLIYEYMPNKDLDSFIFDKEKCKSFDWPKRYNIVNGIARGLLYLHQDSRLRIIHRDLKASNILLDYEMSPKISDFGLARILGGSETQASTRRVVGTYGYMPPEYAIDGLFSAKSDVYSFGVLLIEIICGKKNRGFHHPDHNLNLIGYVWRCYNEDNLWEVADKVTLDSNNQHQVFRVIQIGLLCVQEYPEDRPDMSSVVMMLSSKIALPTSKQPGFLTERRRPQERSSLSSYATSSSHNSYSISFFAPR